MSIDAIKFNIRPIEPVIPEIPGGVSDAGKADKKTEFSSMLKSVMSEVDGLQNEAEKQITGISTGQDGFTTHGAMIALEKADVAFQLMTTIRTKIIRAYEEVLRTQI